MGIADRRFVKANQPADCIATRYRSARIGIADRAAAAPIAAIAHQTADSRTTYIAYDRPGGVRIADLASAISRQPSDPGTTCNRSAGVGVADHAIVDPYQSADIAAASVADHLTGCKRIADHAAPVVAIAHQPADVVAARNNRASTGLVDQAADIGADQSADGIGTRDRSAHIRMADHAVIDTDQATHILIARD